MNKHPAFPINSIKGKSNLEILILFIIIILAIGTISDKKLAKISAQQSLTYEQDKKLANFKLYHKKVLSTLGDSVTQGNTWQPYIINELGFANHNNVGVSGSRVSGDVVNSMWKDDRIEKIPADSDVIIFMGGTNDWSQNVELGSVNSKNTNTFYGALNVFIDKLTAKFPNSKIIFMSTTFAKNTNRPVFHNKVGFVNNLNLRNIDYGLAIENVADARHITFINLTDLWNETNISDYVSNENEVFIHPNAKGGQKIAEAIVNSLGKEALGS